MHLTQEELQIAFESGIIDADTVRKHIEMNERQKYLKMHEPKIWQSTDGKWYTFVPDDTKEKGKKLVKRGTKEKLEDVIVAYYKDTVETQTIEKTYQEWIARKLLFYEIEQQTVERYDVDFEKYFGACKDKNIKTVTEDFLELLILDNIKKYNLKAKAWSNMRTVLRGIFLYAKKKGYTKINISELLEGLDLSKKLFNHDKKSDENVIYTKSEIDTIVGHIKNSKSLNDIAILFAIYTGMRVGEIVSLKWEDVSENFIHVNRTQIRYKDENGKTVHEVRNFPKTEAGIRDVVIISELKPAIKRLRTINPFTEYLFEKNGQCIHKHTVATRLYNLCNLFGFPRKGMHALRRFYATTLINAGVDEIIIANQMGHTDINTTRKHYYKKNAEQEQVMFQVSEAFNVSPTPLNTFLIKPHRTIPFSTFLT